MGADMISTVVKDLIDRDAADDTGRFAPYRRIVDVASDRQIAAALVMDGDFISGLDDETSREHGTLLDALSDGDDGVAAKVAEHSDLVQRGRDHITDALPLLFSRENAYTTIGGVRVIVAGGLSWGDDPFEGFASVDSIACLMENTGHGVNPTTVYVAHVDDHGVREQSVHYSEQGARAWVEATLRGRWVFLFDTPAPGEYDLLVEKSWNDGRGVSCGVDATPFGN
ncbi:MAG: hypothetical protein L0H59_07160 [Tomitella sp.]|nr:hypothetical protein [Tomitella sp.]